MNEQTKQAQTLLRVFEGLGVPLIGAVDEFMTWQATSGTDAEEDAARAFAALLSSTIGTGTTLAGRLAPASADEAEDVRLKTVTLTGAIIARHYAMSGELPDEAFNRRLGAAFDAMLSLADSFSVPDTPAEDLTDTQILAARIEAMSPFVQAVMRFPFGGQEGTLIRRLGENLCERASALASAFEDEQSTTPNGQVGRELAFLKGTSQLLARSCEIEMDLMQDAINKGQITQPPAPDALIDNIWTRFEGGLNVLRAVIGFMADPAKPAHNLATQKTKAPISAPPAPQKAPDEPKAAPAAPAGIPGNPMSFFVKKDDDATSGEGA